MVDRPETIPVITDEEELSRYGVCRARLPVGFDCEKWAAELSQVSPLNLAHEDGEYALYRNIMDESGFPFENILESEIGKVILHNFRVNSFDEIRLDDAFCVHYNMSQQDTTGAKHTDPSDITVNMCIENSKDTKGSQVLFHGRQSLEKVRQGDEAAPDKFLVEQLPGYATIHWGIHPHETTALRRGRRTNIVLTYCYTDPNKSDVESRTCYTP